MTPVEGRQWAVEQAVASFGAEGCSTNWNMEQRIDLFLRLIEPEDQPYAGPTVTIDTRESV